MKEFFFVFLICIFLTLNACVKKVESKEEAIALSKKEIASVIQEDKIRLDSLILVSASWSKDLSIWVVSFENKPKSYRLNVLIKNADAIEIHKLDNRP